MRLLLIILIQSVICNNTSAQTIRVGAKHFNESYILGEVLAQLIENEGFRVERKFNLGGTAVCYEALRGKGIDLYPEYTGSLAEEILKSDKKLNHQSLNEELQSKLGLEMSPSFGFNNTYALATTPKIAEARGLKTISDLQSAEDMAAAMSYEFLKRKDGWENLKSAYQLKISPAGIEHGLAYQAITNGKIELTDVYSTDGEIKKYNFFLLEDDLEFFPTYYAVAVYNQSLDPKVKAIASKLGGIISEDEMQAMNSEVLFEKNSFSEVAHSFL
ncbi:MAG: glycine betaine ABC transporter substrate-binding protein, partial [Cyclobacteriaceae bacterium]